MNSFTQSKSKEEIKAFQEKKAYNDFVYQTNVTIQAIQTGLVALTLTVEKLSSKFESDKKSIKIDFENLKEKIDSESDSWGHLLADYGSEIIKLTTGLSKKFQDIENKIALAMEAKQLASMVERRCNDLEKIREVDWACIESSFNHQKGQLNEQIRLVREDLSPKEDLLAKAKESIGEHLNPIKIDFQGLIKEIELLKKAVKYSEKKFENIYTLIERLKEGHK